MRRIYGASLVLLACAALAPLAAAPPTLELPAEVKGEPGAFVQVPAKTDGKVVQWKAIDAGLNLFPVDLLRDTKTAVVTAAKAGRYRLIAVTAKGDELSPFAETLIVIGDAPQPPPVPPGPNPPEPPTPAPQGFRVIFVWETSKAITQGELNAAYAEDVVQYLRSRTVSNSSFRRWDPDVDVSKEPDPAMRELWAAVQKTKPTADKYVIIAVDGKATIEPFPKSAEESLALLKKYAEGK